MDHKKSLHIGTIGTPVIKQDKRITDILEIFKVKLKDNNENK